MLDTSSDAKRASSFFKHDIVRGDINPARISIQYLVSSSLHVVPRVILVSIPLLLCLFLFNGVSSSCNSSASRTYQKKKFFNSANKPKPSKTTSLDRTKFGSFVHGLRSEEPFTPFIWIWTKSKTAKVQTKSDWWQSILRERDGCQTNDTLLLFYPLPATLLSKPMKATDGIVVFQSFNRQQTPDFYNVVEISYFDKLPSSQTSFNVRALEDSGPLPLLTHVFGLCSKIWFIVSPHSPTVCDQFICSSGSRVIIQKSHLSLITLASLKCFQVEYHRLWGNSGSVYLHTVFWILTYCISRWHFYSKEDVYRPCVASPGRVTWLHWAGE